MRCLFLALSALPLLLTSATAAAQDTAAVVHVDGPSDARLQRLDGASWTTVCSGPCDLRLPVDPNASYRIDASGMKASAPFQIRPRGEERVVLRARHERSALRPLGITTSIVGGAAMLLGFTVAAFAATSGSSSSGTVVPVGSGGLLILPASSHSSASSDGTIMVGGCIIAAGLGLVIAGVVMTSEGTTAPVVTNASGAALSPRQPTFRDTRETDPAPSPGLFVLPLVSSRF